MLRQRWLSHGGALAAVLTAIALIPALISQVRALPAQQSAPPSVQTLTIALDAAAIQDSSTPDGVVQRTVTAEPLTVDRYSYLWFSWQQADDDLSLLQLEFRSGPDMSGLSEWQPISPGDDRPAADTDATRRFSTQYFAGDGSRVLQVRSHARPRSDGSFPAVAELTASFLDTSSATTTPRADLIEPRQTGRSNVRPPIVSRTAWGNPDGQLSPRVPEGWTTYYPTTHIVIHHTATPNWNSENPVARLQSIWHYHANTLGWGDIGYNYLIDRNGVIYEGRAGGDNVSGFHDAANEASLGIALIGTYSGEPPSAAAQQALVNLIAWKVEQRGLDPNGSAFYLGCADFAACVAVNPGAQVAVITTHRDIARSTTCPGDAFYALLGGIRQRVTQQLGTVLTEKLTIEENDAGFSRSSANWYTRSCGSGGSSLDTYATDLVRESTNTGTWSPTIVRAGSYRVQAYIAPNCGGGERTRDARYRVVYNGGATYVSLDQHNNTGGWFDLGTYPFAPGVAAVTLTDLNSEPYAMRRWITYDAVRWVPAVEELTLVSVSYPRTEVQVGELLEVRFTVRNSGTLPVEGQSPAAAVRTSSSATAFDLNGYVYNTDECFVAPTGAAYPSYPKQTGRFRVLLGGVSDVVCAGDNGALEEYPWRWGIGSALQPGQSRTLVGYLRFKAAGTYTLRAGLNQENVAVLARNVAPTMITVAADSSAPLPVLFTDLLQPQAQVLRLAPIPANALNRALDARHVRTQDVLGRFSWAGETRQWATTGPVSGAEDNFVIQQTRVISVPISGEYVFRLTADDMGWLWVNGQPVASILGLGDQRVSDGKIVLAAGRHTLAVKIVARTGPAAAGYQVLAPGAGEFTLVTDGAIDADMSTTNRVGNTFRTVNGLWLAADSLGGPRPAVRLLYSGNVWAEAPNGLLNVAALADNQYELVVRADRGGVLSEDSLLRLNVNAVQPFYRQLMPYVTR